MKNTLSRVSTFSSILFNTTLGLLFCIFLASYLNPGYPVSSNLKISWISPNPNFKSLRFEPNIDLTPQFTFNTKQIFIYLVLRTQEDSGNLKEEMTWSKIVKNGDNYKLFEMEKSNSIFSGSLTGGYEFELRGNIFPYVGQLRDISYGSIKYKNE